MYVRATCFELIGHPQGLQEHRCKRYLVFVHDGIPNAQVSIVNGYKLVSVERVV